MSNQLPPAVHTAIVATLTRLRDAGRLRSRPQQQAMISRVARTLLAAGDVEKPNLLVVEGPTGTGKTFGYLIPGLVVARHLQKTLVVSTATVALQEQLVSRDLPEIARYLDAPLKIGLAKGRGRYVCEYKLAEMTGDGGLQPAIQQKVKALYDRRTREQWSGELDALKASDMPGFLRDRLAANRRDCLGKHCPEISRCSSRNARESWREVDVLVVNHDLLLSDIAMGGGVILPIQPEDMLLVCDEAHHLPDKAVNHLAKQLPIMGLGRATSQLRDVVGSMLTLWPNQQARLNPVKTTADFLEQALFPLETQLSALAQPQGGRLQMLPLDGADPDLVTLLQDVQAGVNGLREGADGMRKFLEQQLESGATAEESIRRLLQALQAGVDVLIGAGNCLTAILVPGLAHLPQAVWLELQLGERGVQECLLKQAVAWPGPLLKAMLWSRIGAAVLASATVTAMGKFDLFAKKAGLQNNPRVQFQQLPTPFDFASQGVLRVPAMRSDPRRTQEHTAEIAAMLPGLLGPQEGSLILFTAESQMKSVLEQLPPQVRAMCLVQNQAPRDQLLESHAARIRAGQGSVLVGLASFAEGLDLPGDLCRHVVLAKLPFGVPEHPLDQALAAWIEEHGGNHFQDIVLPETHVKLTQAVGRLIRTETDSGTVTILDRRLVDKQFGRALLAGLPPFRRDIEKGDGARLKAVA